MSQAETPESLRARARSIRQSAQYAQGSCYYDEMRQSTEMEAKADKLEATQNLQEEKRKKLVAKVKIAQKQLAIDDDTYRDLLFSVTKQRSASKLKVLELENVLKRLSQLGFKPKPAKASGDRKQADDAQSKMIRALWLELHDTGKVRDSSEKALVNFAKGQFKTTAGVEALQWLSVRQKRRLIEQLKLWLAR